MRKFESKKFWVMSLVVSVLVLGMLSNGYARKEEVNPAEEHLAGPAIIATFTATPFVIMENGLPVDMVRATVIGQCSGNPISIPADFPAAVLGASFSEVTEAHLEDLRIDASSVPASCSPHDSSPEIILNTVTKFTNMGTLIQAEVVGLFIITK